MEKGFQLSQEQKLQQRLTPLQVRYVRMLEMSGPEFEEEVRNAVDEMPALEASTPDNVAADMETSVTEDGDRFTESASDMQIADYGSEDDIPDYLSRQMFRSSQASPEDYYEPVLGAGEDSLLETLTRQLDEQDVTDEERLIARYIIGNLDDNGYLTRDMAAVADDIAFSEGRDFPMEMVRKVWNIVRSLDPPGIGAVDLRDCLLLQLKRLPRTVGNLAALEVVRDYFDLFAKKHFQRIVSAMGIDDDRMKEAVGVISRLNPKPASLLESTGGGAARGVTPDFLVEADTEGNLTLTLLNRIPELSVERTFAADAPLPESSDRGMAAARIFLKQKRDEATDFIKIVGMRQHTLFTVMSAILDFQRPFFLTEDEAQIRPMVLRELAAATGFDLSVVSRATQGKYVMTPHGLYPLKMFFNERRRKEETSGEGDADNTTPMIIAALKGVIEEEDKRHPLSDEQITRKLTEKGFDIARRTVAKYREKLGFPVGRLRRTL
ncbi:MAG: RNA polymerase factor sigma-54 [Muribaculaceae bacterium]|nr:RNA polymerase factor sigma-54 [Muribaculaceae bacterium]